MLLSSSFARRLLLLSFGHLLNCRGCDQLPCQTILLRKIAETFLRCLNLCLCATEKKFRIFFYRVIYVRLCFVHGLCFFYVTHCSSAYRYSDISLAVETLKTLCAILVWLEKQTISTHNTMVTCIRSV